MLSCIFLKDSVKLTNEGLELHFDVGEKYYIYTLLLNKRRNCSFLQASVTDTIRTTSVHTEPLNTVPLSVLNLGFLHLSFKCKTDRGMVQLISL